MLLQGAVFDDSNLSGASFRRADLYWSNFFRADLTGAFSLTESVGRLMTPGVTIDTRHESTLVRYYQRDGRFPASESCDSGRRRGERGALIPTMQRPCSGEQSRVVDQLSG